MPKHPIVHIEFSTRDREASGKFYADLFDRQIQQIPEMNYATFEAEGGPGGGFNPISENNPAGTVLIYVGTDDIEASLTKAESLGAKILVHQSEIQGMGFWGVFQDPDGNQVALYKALRQ
jgi:predicted enzyme related to lactoylglutathione lyase